MFFLETGVGNVWKFWLLVICRAFFLVGRCFREYVRREGILNSRVSLVFLWVFKGFVKWVRE